MRWLFELSSCNCNWSERYVLVCAGHGLKVDQGKFDLGVEVDGVAECMVAAEIVRRLGVISRMIGLPVLTYSGFSYPAKTRWLQRMKEELILAIDVHVNAFRDSKVNGTEVLIHSRHLKSSVCKKAKALAEMLSDALGYRNRGVKGRVDLEFLNVVYPFAAYVVEPGFLTNPKCWKDIVFGDFIEKVSQTLLRFIVEEMEVVR